MAKDPKTRALSIAAPVAALKIGALVMLTSAAFGAPPQNRLQSHMQSPQSPVQATQRLDLRPPAHALEGMEKSPGAFPSMGHRQNNAQQPLELPMMGSSGTRARPTIQEFVQRVHREGLPVARLFETKSALVHVGLSPRGKPGLWLVQKTR